MLGDRLGKLRGRGLDQRSIDEAQKPAGKPPGPLFKRDPRSRVIHERQRGGAKVGGALPELQTRKMLDRLVPVVRRRHEAQRCAVLERKRQPIQGVDEQHVGREQIRQNHGRAVSVLPAKNDRRHRAAWRDPRRDMPVEEVCKANTAPSKRAPAPSGYAVEIADLLDARQTLQGCLQDQGGQHVTRQPQLGTIQVPWETVGIGGQPKAREIGAGSLAWRKVFAHRTFLMSTRGA